MNYTELKTQITSYTKRADLTSSLDTFIDFFEAHVNATLRVAPMEVNITASPVSGLVTLPSDYLGMRRVKSGTSTLNYVTPDRFLDFGTTSANVYTIVGNVLDPNTSEDIVYTYYQKVPALSSSNLTNWLIDSYPNAYLYGCVAEAMIFSKGDASIPLQLREATLNGVKKSDKKARWGGTPLRQNTSNKDVV